MLHTSLTSFPFFFFFETIWRLLGIPTARGGQAHRQNLTETEGRLLSQNFCTKYTEKKFLGASSEATSTHPAGPIVHSTHLSTLLGDGVCDTRMVSYARQARLFSNSMDRTQSSITKATSHMKTKRKKETTFYCLFVFLSCTPSTHVTESAPLPLQHCQVSGSHRHPCNH